MAETHSREVASMFKKFMNNQECLDVLTSITERVEPFLEEGHIYYSTPVKETYGSSGGSLFEMIDGERVWCRKEDLTDAVDNLPHGGSLSSILGIFPPKTKVCFTFCKGEPLKVEPLDALKLMDNLKEELFLGSSKRLWRKFPGQRNCEALINFSEQAEDLALDVTWSEFIPENTRSFEHCIDGSDEVECLYFALDKKLEILHLTFSQGELTLKSQPPFPEFGLEAVQSSSVAVDEETQILKDASLKAVDMRAEFFQSLGTLDPREIFLNVGGFRDHSWPGYSTTKQVAKFRVVHSPASTLLFTDGLSDIYSDVSKDKEKVYNGIGCEFYLEFKGHIPFEEIKNHYLNTVLNGVSQVAIGHRTFKDYMTRKKTSTIEFNLADLSTYVFMGGEQCNDISTFYPESKYSRTQRLGVLLGLESSVVPQTLKLNREEILLVNVKPFTEQWLDRLSGDDDTADRARGMLIIEMNEREEGNLIPLDYLTTEED